MSGVRFNNWQTLRNENGQAVSCEEGVVDIHDHVFAESILRDIERHAGVCESGVDRARRECIRV